MEGFWVSNCGCREGRGGCARSRMDVCLLFGDGIQTSGSGKREITREEVNAIFREAEEKRLVTRPFRDEDDRSATVGICFCCDDCCAYFRHPEEKCGRGPYVARTEIELCNHCGSCVEVCYFGARKMEGGKLVVDEGKCYGCGLCAKVCGDGCVGMVAR